MANLATMIMEGTAIYGSSKLKHKYDHVDGPALIAMESAEALRDIFETAFYENNACSIRAVAEGYTDFDSSPYAATMEGIFADAFQKIKDFFIKLKDKIMAFFHSMIRFLSGIFMDGKKWVSKYEKELNAIRSKLKDYQYHMYTYKHLEDAPDSMATKYSTITSYADKPEEVITHADYGTFAKNNNGSVERDDKPADEQYVKFVQGLGLTNFKSEDDDVQKESWSYFRDGADNDGDKEDQDVSSFLFFGDAIKALKESDKLISKIQKALNAADKAFKACIKAVDKAANKKDDETSKLEDKTEEQKVTKATGNLNVEKLRAFSSFVSRCQSAMNTFMNAWKSAVQERNKDYQRALVGAFAYARKNSTD